MGNELIPSQPHTPQIIQLRKGKLCLITWDQTCGLVLQVYFTYTGAIRRLSYYQWTSPDKYGWINHIDKQWIVNITRAKTWEQDTRNVCIFPGTYFIKKSLIFNEVYSANIIKPCHWLQLKNIWSFYILQAGDRPPLQDMTATIPEPISFPEIAAPKNSFNHSSSIHCVIIGKYVA